MSETFFIVWRSLNVILAAAGLILLWVDLHGRRRSPSLPARFYWQAVVLLLVGTGWGSVDALFHGETPVLPRITLTTVALGYFVISLLIEIRGRRNGRSRDEESQPGSAG